MLLNLKHDIHMLQQNSYRISRYWRWLRSDMGSVWRLVDVAVLFLLISHGLLPRGIAALIAGTVALCKIVMILRAKFKKPLVFTHRVWRIYCVTAVLALAAPLATALSPGGSLPALGSDAATSLVLIWATAIISWAFVIAAVWILIPVERGIAARYRNDAKRILASMPDLKVIGITGSYGKTSTKHFLQRILSEEFDTLMTPGSYNTPMGVVRTIREMMKPYTQIFICEMGAKQRGDIKEICDIVNPEYGIITAVGPMHLETFGDIKTVQSTKFELADAIPADGFVVVNNDFPHCADRKVGNTRCIRYAVGESGVAAYTASDIHYSKEGTEFTAVGPDGWSLRLRTPLLGECNISNLTAAVAVARELGVGDEKIRYAVRGIEPVRHRLSAATSAAGITVIDDAFNSNPLGAKMAVDVLSQFSGGGKRIIVTPGMVELGTQQERLNRALGRYIAGRVDVAVIVASVNREALLAGIAEGDGDSTETHAVDTFEQAQTLLAGILAPGDTVLYENDLPDSFK